MKISLVIHPGMPKCASSSIQGKLIQNRQTLANHGIFLLGRDLRIKPSNVSMVGAPYTAIHDLRNGTVSWDSVLTFLYEDLETLTNCSNVTVVLSSEVLCEPAHGGWGEVHQAIAESGVDLSVGIVVRAPWRYALSSWRQGPFRKGITFKQYCDDIMARAPRDGNDGAWSNRLQRFAEIYGHEALNVFPLELTDDIVGDYTDWLSGGTVRFDGSSNRNNASLNALLCDVLASRPDIFKEEVADNEYRSVRVKAVLKRATRRADQENWRIFSSCDDWWCRREVLELGKHFSRSYAAVSTEFGGVPENKAVEVVERDLGRIQKWAESVENPVQEKGKGLESLLGEVFSLLSNELKRSESLTDK